MNLNIKNQRLFFLYQRFFGGFFKHIYVWQGVTPQVAEILFSKNIFFQEAVFEKRGTVHSLAEAFKIVHSCSLIKKKTKVQYTLHFSSQYM